MEGSGGNDPGVREQARALKDEFHPRKLEESLEGVMEERPAARRMLDFDVVLKAVAIAAVVALLLWLLIGPKIAAVALVLVFVGAWYGLARLDYERRRPTRDVGADDGDARATGPGDEGEEDDADPADAEGNEPPSSDRPDSATDDRVERDR